MAMYVCNLFCRICTGTWEIDFKRGTSWDFLLTGIISPWSSHAPTGGAPLAHGAVLVSKAVRTSGVIVASVWPPRKFPMLQRVSGTTLHFPDTVYGLSLPQVGKMRRKLGPLPSQVVRLNPGQSRSERHAFEGGPRKSERAGDARKRAK